MLAQSFELEALLNLLARNDVVARSEVLEEIKASAWGNFVDREVQKPMEAVGRGQAVLSESR